MVARDRLPRLLCGDCRDVIAALSETYDAAVFAEDIPRRVGFGREVRARDGLGTGGWYGLRDTMNLVVRGSLARRVGARGAQDGIRPATGAFQLKSGLAFGEQTITVRATNFFNLH